ncbi:unnamed protein product [Acanthoscelides obtectus]|uniref:Uncharacterized protein n=1 Tax=Acanthoscelides obtectus TaxID=200917 RepID=A0A9P0QDC4_ACAOB|nr:unnamed protein product [Acanthoscelides obtectus]CAK1688048.1 hypothetical protein AOBTE_LOCUS36531 [Acanthoscelides obtectus]
MSTSTITNRPSQQQNQYRPNFFSNHRQRPNFIAEELTNTEATEQSQNEQEYDEQQYYDPNYENYDQQEYENSDTIIIMIL